MRYVLYVSVLLLLGYLFTGVVQVRPGERAVVRRFGRVLEEKPGPGLHIGLPWGMDRVDRVPVDMVRRVRMGYQPVAEESTAAPPGQLLTGDHNLVNVTLELHYRVIADHVEDYMVQRADQADSLVARLAEAALAEWVAGRTVDEVLLSGKSALPGWLVSETQKRLRPYHLGVEVQDASVAYLAPPDEVKLAFDDVTRAQTEIKTRIYEAEQEARNTVRRAQTDQYRIEQQTAAYTREQRLRAQVEAESFNNRLARYRQLRQENPDFLGGIWWDEMGRLFTLLKNNGQLDLLDHHLGADGLDITVFPPVPKKK